MRPVQYDEGLNLAAEIGAVKYMECSALSQRGLSAAFEESVRAAIQNYIDSKKSKKKSKGGCTLLWKHVYFSFW